MLTDEDAATFGRCISVGGVAVFPADTVYGLACEPDLDDAVDRLYRLKGRRPDKPAAVMFFRLDLALAALPELGPNTREAVERLLPGPYTLLLPNPARRFPLACGPDPTTLGLRVPKLPPEVETLESVSWPVLQSSANRSGGPDARTLAEVPEPIRAAADLVLDGGELPGTPSTVVDLRPYEQARDWRVLREGAASSDTVAARLRYPAHPRRGGATRTARGAVSSSSRSSSRRPRSPPPPPSRSPSRRTTPSTPPSAGSSPTPSRAASRAVLPRARPTPRATSPPRSSSASTSSSRPSAS